MSEPTLTAPITAPTPHESATSVARFDAAVDRALDHLRGRPVADRVFYTASELGDFSLLWHLIATAKGLRHGGDPATTVRIWAALGLESVLVNGVIKSFFGRSRPVTDVPRPHRLRQPRTSSFPSGHASAATVFTIIAGEDDPWMPVYAALAAVVAVSRAHVRIHHASDVVGGVIVGSAFAAAMRHWWPVGRPWPRGLNR